MTEQINELMKSTKGAYKYHVMEINALEEGTVYTVAVYGKVAQHIKTVDLHA